MTASLPRHRRALVIPAGMAMATALAFLPNTAATAAPADAAPAAVSADASSLSYVVNVKGGHATSAFDEWTTMTPILSYDVTTVPPALAIAFFTYADVACPPLTLTT